MKRFSVLLAAALLIAGCREEKPAPAPAAKAGGAVTASNRHPLSKYLELVGFRMSEKGQGKLTVKFGVVNHSDADVATLGLKVQLRPASDAAAEPFCTFEVKVPNLGPQEIASATGDCVTKLRIYELPDWQFVRPSFEITAPAP